MSARAVLDRVRRFGDMTARRVADAYLAGGGRADRWERADQAVMNAVLRAEERRPGARRGLLAEIAKLRLELEAEGGAS